VTPKANAPKKPGNEFESLTIHGVERIEEANLTAPARLAHHPTRQRIAQYINRQYQVSVAYFLATDVTY